MDTEAEKEAQRRLKEFSDAIKNSSGADKAALAMAALDGAQNADHVSTSMKRWAYLISVGIPPVGLIFAAVYFFSKKIDGKKVALICTVLTVAGLLIAWLLLAIITMSIPPEIMSQLQTVKVEDYKDLLQ